MICAFFLVELIKKAKSSGYVFGFKMLSVKCTLYMQKIYAVQHYICDSKKETGYFLKRM